MIKSLETYRVTYGATGDPYVGINVASVALLLDRLEEATRVATAIRNDLGSRFEGELDHWGRATLAEAYLVLGDVENAAQWYEKAVARALNRPQDIAVMRRQARLLLPKQGKAATILDAALPVPPVVAFSGHMTDAPGRAIPRFPESKREAVRRKLHTWLSGQGARVHGVCSAARGADLLFLEELLALRGTATVVLPFPAVDFKRISVGQGWDGRFDAVLGNDRVDSLSPLLDTAPTEAELADAFEQCNIRIVDEADRLAKLFDDEDPVLLTVWNGNPGDASGGTAHAVTIWQQRQHRTHNADVATL